jgi:transketolase
MKPTIRLAALLGLPIIYVFTHDSIGLGEDGPTHQPIEQLIGLRAIPNLVVYRPAEAGETAVGWQVALQRKDGPTALVLTRQGLPTFDPAKLTPTSEAARGAYILSDVDNPTAILMGSGSEVHIALEAQSLLAQEGIAARVVSMPSWELFEQQPAHYRESVLPTAIKARVSIEAAVTHGWNRYTGSDGITIGLNRFGASAPYQEVYEHLGITAEAMVEVVKQLLKLY